VVEGRQGVRHPLLAPLLVHDEGRPPEDPNRSGVTSALGRGRRDRPVDRQAIAARPAPA
jgi:hypothetical protein